MRRIGLAILLSVSFLSVPLITEGQQTGSPRRVGFLLVGLTPESSEAQHFALLPGPSHSSRGRERRHTDMDIFHGDWRAPKASRPIITVDATEDAMQQLLAAFGIPSLDFAIGEPEQEEVMIRVSTAGSFPFPQVVVAGTRVSVRAADLAGHDVQVRVSGSDAI
jgi:hypothetical protein